MNQNFILDEYANSYKIHVRHDCLAIVKEI